MHFQKPLSIKSKENLFESEPRITMMTSR